MGKVSSHSVGIREMSGLYFKAFVANCHIEGVFESRAKSKKRFETWRPDKGSRSDLIRVKHRYRFTRGSFKTLGNPMRKRGTFSKRLVFQSLAHQPVDF